VVVGCVEGALEIRVHDVDVLFMEFGVVHHYNDGGEGVVYAAVLSESVLLLA
jgi:hypothetical protein